MIQIIGAIFIGVWFYRVARINEKSGRKWLFIGLVVYFLPSILWSIFCHLIMPSIFKIFDSYVGVWEDIIPILIGLGIGIVGLGLGIAAAVLVRRKFLPKRESLKIELSPENIIIWIKLHRQLILRVLSIIMVIYGGFMVICMIMYYLTGSTEQISPLVFGIIFLVLGVFLFMKSRKVSLKR